MATSLDDHPPKCPPCAESSSSAAAEVAAHAANVPNKCRTARHSVHTVALRVSCRVSGISQGLSQRAKAKAFII